MRILSRFISPALTVCLLVAALQAEPPRNVDHLKKQVALMGADAEVRIRLISGKRLEGSIGRIEADTFELILVKDSMLRRIDYVEVKEIRGRTLTYRADDGDPAVRARSIVAGLGFGKHIKVKLDYGETIHGDLRQAQEDYFEVLPDRQSRTTRIPYASVEELAPSTAFHLTGKKVFMGFVIFYLALPFFTNER